MQQPPWSRKTKILQMILAKDGIIPKGRFNEMLSNYVGRGYQYLFAVMGMVHPKLLETPAKAFPCHPEQRINESFQSYTKRFEYFRQMEALICDRVHDLSVSHTQDSFILKSRHSETLLDLVKEERDSPNSTKTGYYSSQLFLHTVDKLVNNNNLENKKTGRYNSYKRSTGRNNITSAKSINLIGPNDSDPYTFTANSLQQYLLNELDDDECEDDMVIRLIHALPAFVKGTASGKPDRACAICGDFHPFDLCPTLNNHELTKKLCIKLSLAANRFRRALDANDQAKPERRIPVNQLQLYSFSDMDSLTASMTETPVHSVRSKTPTKSNSVNAMTKAYHKNPEQYVNSVVNACHQKFSELGQRVNALEGHSAQQKVNRQIARTNSMASVESDGTENTYGFEVGDFLLGSF